MKETVIRSITGILFVAVVLLMLGLHPLTFLGFLIILQALAWFEFIRLFNTLNKLLNLWQGIIFGGLFIVSGYLISRGLAGPLILIAPLLLMVFMFYPPDASLIKLPAILYLSAAPFLLNFMAFTGSSGFLSTWPVVILIIIWTYDSMAYVSGRLAGRHIIWKKVSPKKTWEGLAGGLVFAMLAAIFLENYFHQITPVQWMVLAGIIVLSSTAGDFLESAVKRKAGVKDSGGILPGHGGILDRFDSFFLAVPFAYIYLRFILNIF